MNKIVFIDSEIGAGGQICDLGAVSETDELHTQSTRIFSDFVKNFDFVCGHNIFCHDLKYIGKFCEQGSKKVFVDTLPFSPLLFPQKPYHKLVKDDKLIPEHPNNPLNDAKKAQTLFFDELNAFDALRPRLKFFFCSLLFRFEEFQGFFKYIGYAPLDLTARAIKEEFKGEICSNADVDSLMKNCPRELAYALAIISCNDKQSVTPPWVLRNYPQVQNCLKILCGTRCEFGCAYCNKRLELNSALERIFGFKQFRTYEGEPLQYRAAKAAITSQSILAIFPTGGGKSVTFQLPALLEWEVSHALTVVISPLQALMKDQIDSLESKGIDSVVTINGLLNPLERADAVKKVYDGSASMLYISPEQLRSKTVEKMLLSRTVARFVIDEAHCFSAWGQDFRVDYLYIGQFIRDLQNKKGLVEPIPVSCFTATAKPKVVQDIHDYFYNKLNLDLRLISTNASRANLHYQVLRMESESEKYNALRELVQSRNCPTIVYVSRTRRTRQIAEKLSDDGFSALPFNGRMDTEEKIHNQEAFMKNEVQVMVATSAFGMGVDKKDVKLVVHYDISDSLENYIQEAGRAGRDSSLDAECFILFNDDDLNKNFILLNQTKVSLGDIQHVWKAIKEMTKTRSTIFCSALEIAREAGWDDSMGSEMETRIKTAISALEQAGYIKRGKNVPHIYATSLTVKNMQQASDYIEKTPLLDSNEKRDARRIVKCLVSARSFGEEGETTESRVDYIADILGISLRDVISTVNILRQIGVLADDMDMTAYFAQNETENKSSQIFNKFSQVENFLSEQMTDEGASFNLKELNDRALNEGIGFSSVKALITIRNFWTSIGLIKKAEYFSQQRTDLIPAVSVEDMCNKIEKRMEICKFVIERMYDIVEAQKQLNSGVVKFSLVGMLKDYSETPHLIQFEQPVDMSDVEEALLYLSKIGAIKLEGGFLVSYNTMEIRRLVADNKIRYKKEDYSTLNEFYQHKIQQIHFVGEYANMMVRNYEAALQYVADYFRMDYKPFVAKYFKGKEKSIDLPLTARKYEEITGDLSPRQKEIICDNQSKIIVVAAGPGSGKTRVLVHKMAALMMLEGVKHEQMLMVTFSRAAATEFKKRLCRLVGNAANFVEIKTFHSYCFDLLGKIGNLKDSENVVRDAAAMIENGEVEPGRICKAVVVIDEAQDMDENEFALIKALMSKNEDMRVIAVGDDDQNVYEFRKSNSAYMRSLIKDYDGTFYEMIQNFRSKSNIVALANWYVQKISSRMKDIPCEAVQRENGIVRLTHHTGGNIETAIVNEIAARESMCSVGVLTETNEQALCIAGQLKKKNIRANVISGLEKGLRLRDLVEVRYFLDQISKNSDASPIISNKVWNNAKKALAFRFEKSSCLKNCLNMLNKFETVNTSTKYRTDFEEFVDESRFEDFYPDDEKDVVWVSTIHKAKGREYQAVYLLLSGTDMTDEEKRKIYVGLTRAQSELYVHYTKNIFSGIDVEGVETRRDETLYDDPSEMFLQLTHEDVYLDFFKYNATAVGKVFAGDDLLVKGCCLCWRTLENNVVRFSEKCEKKLAKLQERGYAVADAKAQLVVLWHKKDETEVQILLPQLHLVKEVKK